MSRGQEAIAIPDQQLPMQQGEGLVQKSIRAIFGSHSVVGLAFGVPLLLFPGRLLTWFQWAPIDPIISRILGAALLALAWSSFRVWRTEDSTQVTHLVELELIFTGLASVGILRHLISGRWPWIVWAILALYLLFTAAWGYVLYVLRKQA